MPIKLWIYKKFALNRNESPKYHLVYKALIYKNTFRTIGQFMYWVLFYFGLGHYRIQASERGSRRKKFFVNGKIINLTLKKESPRVFPNEGIGGTFYNYELLITNYELLILLLIVISN